MHILKYLSVVPYNEKAAYEYGKISAHLYRSGFTVGQLDIEIAASAVVNDMILVTNNTKDFRNIPGIELEDWLIR